LREVGQSLRPEIREGAQEQGPLPSIMYEGCLFEWWKVSLMETRSMQRGAFRYGENLNLKECFMAKRRNNV
jgi:hypothetical protein